MPPVETPADRVCVRCEVAKPLAAFITDRRKPGGKGYQCKACRRAYVAERPAKWPPSPFQDTSSSAARAAIAKQGGIMRQEAWPRGGSFTAGSVATGIGGLELGVSQVLDVDLRWIADDDPDCEAILDYRFPGVPNLGDVELVNWKEIAPVDLLIAGIPCQPYSYAGKMLEEADDRDLWPAVRIIIKRLQPGYVFIENVPGFLRRGLARTARDLAQAGYVGRWGCVRALDVEAPHVRDRVFVLAAHTDALERWGTDRAGTHTPPGSPFADGDGADRSGDLHPGGALGARDWGPFLGPVQRWERARGAAPELMVEGRPNPGFVEWMMGFPVGWTEGIDRVDRLAALGNSCMPAQAADALHRLLGTRRPAQ